jgi:Spy/CpxP family protein refolding chaperone
MKNPSMTRTAPTANAARPLRLLAMTLLLALAGAAVHTAQAAGPMEGRGGPGMHGGAGMPAGPGGWAMADPRRLDHLLDSLNASTEQRTQIKQIVAAAQADLRAQREQGRALHQQSQALFTQPTVDARAAEVLRQQMLAQHDQASKRTLQLMLDVSRVLTPEQRAKVAERMNQRRALMERHRAEREALDKAAK